MCTELLSAAGRIVQSADREQSLTESKTGRESCFFAVQKECKCSTVLWCSIKKSAEVQYTEK